MVEGSGWAQGARRRGMVRGEVLGVGRRRCLVEDGRGGGNKKRAK